MHTGFREIPITIVVECGEWGLPMRQSRLGDLLGQRLWLRMDAQWGRGLWMRVGINMG